MSQEPLFQLPLPTPLERRAALEWKVRSYVDVVAPAVVPEGVRTAAVRAVTSLAKLKAPASDAARVVPVQSEVSIRTLSWTAVFDASPSLRTQEEVAAAYAYALLAVRETILADDFQDDANGEPLETASYANFFSTCLVPATKRSHWVCTADAMHIVVLVKGCAFRVELLHHGEVIRRADLVETLRACRTFAETHRTPEHVAPCGMTMHSQAEYIERYAAACSEPTNFESLRTISAALFVVCLDECAPDTDYEIGCAAQGTTEENRWFSHCLQLVVFKNARAAVVGNLLVGMEGSQAIRVFDVLAEAFEKVSGREASTPDAPGEQRAIHVLKWALKSHRSSAGERRPRGQERDRLFTIPFGIDDARAVGCSTTVAFYLVMQACALRQLGRIPRSAHQLVNMRHSEGGGRLGMHNTVSAASRTFCEALLSDASIESKRGLLRGATEAYARTLYGVRNGVAIDHAYSYVQPRSPLLARVLGNIADHADRSDVLARWSLLRLSPGIATLGRFGVTWFEPSVTAGHAYLDAAETTLVVVQGERPYYDLGRLPSDVEFVVKKLRELAP